MKKILTFFCAGVLISILCTVFDELKAQTKTTAWDYPVKPGTPQWAAFTTHREMIEACQVPESVLKSLTTEELVEICLNYPLFGDIWFYDSVVFGFRNESAAFNGMQELFRRKDNVYWLIGRLRGDDIMKLSSKVLSALEVGKLIWRNSYIEFLLSHESVIANANSLQQKEIARIAMRNISIKELDRKTYGRSSIELSAYLLGTTLTKFGVALSPGLEAFLEKGSARDVFVVTDELKRNYINTVHHENDM